MEKETLTVEKDEYGTITYRNASGQLHNTNGPAIVGADGSKWYYINDQLHNPQGPAVVFANGRKSYHIKGKLLTETKFKAWQAEQTSMSYFSEIARIDVLLQEGEFEKIRQRFPKLRIDFPNSPEFDQIETYMNKMDELAYD